MHAAALVLIVPLFCSAAAAAAMGQSLSSLAKQCQFTLGHQRFDLCPIFEDDAGGWTISRSRKTPPTITKTQYHVSLSGALKISKKIPSEEQCPEGTWICYIMSNTRPKHDDEEPRVLRVIPVAGKLSLPSKGDDSKGDEFAAEEYQPGLNITTKLVPANKETKHDILHVHLHGGYYVNEQQKADIQFICDHKAEEPTSPTASYIWNGTHVFEWRTKHACGKTIEKSPPSDPEDDPADDPERDAPPKDAEDDDVPGDSRKLIDPELLASRSRRSMTLFASFTGVVLGIMYVLYFPPPRVRAFMSSYVKRHPWLLRSRVGERALVRWASEDFVFDAGEEDTMVNAEGDLDAIALDEQIPLKPSPRRSVVSNYGTAT
ncbi:uncharacterized protein FIBRA_05588 [Fibroporia radiculosa]|uniref:Autophagy-related protein 27 n=1 Tax=Fibroporia radiculosa TaxID=599839 RepID=J4GRA5_9APHY|nr:uncharacterized protein FIBRA_05588 [Fibroporia radiculosa]CCM03455.1 predicted protein [Fibroporia radiculosa]